MATATERARFRHPDLRDRVKHPTAHSPFAKTRSVRTACADRVLTLRKLLGATENASFDGAEQPAHRQHSTRTYCAYGTDFSDRKI